MTKENPEEGQEKSKKNSKDWIRINHGWYQLSKKDSWTPAVLNRYVIK